jgi:hypothetical protein
MALTQRLNPHHPDCVCGCNDPNSHYYKQRASAAREQSEIDQRMRRAMAKRMAKRNIRKSYQSRKPRWKCPAYGRVPKTYSDCDCLT